MKDLHVIAECVDERDGKRFLPGDMFPSPTKKQAERLTRAGCLADEAPDLEQLVADANANDRVITFTDNLGDQTVAKLKELAGVEGHELGNATVKADIIAAIRKGRQAKSADPAA